MKKTMEEPSKIMRRSIYTFLKHYDRATTAAALVLPFSAALLLSQPFFSSSSSSLHGKLNMLFRGAGFSSSLDFFNILSLKLSQTLSSSLFTLPFALTFLLFSKAYIIKLLSNSHGDSSLYYFRLLRTYICNSFFLLSANASAFALFFVSFNLIESFGLSSRNFYTLFSLSSAIIYSIILANAFVISNLALVSSTSSSSGGYTTILKACLLIQGRTSTALALSLPTNLCLAGVEALFQYRVVSSYYKGDRGITSIALEGAFIAYLYALFLVLDTIVNYLFYQSCVKNDEDQRISREDEYSIKIQISETENTKICIKGPKSFQEIL
uniref:Transmembrane protein n=1 Tax=Brassica campestris TaxID=3711 RepID=M4D907_BRACM